MCLPVKPFKIEREWIHRGLKCTVVQVREQQQRCGYVRVPPGHPVWGKDYNDLDLDVHGGITFGQAEDCIEEDGRGWWVGFDCHHCDDCGLNPNVPEDYVWQDPHAEKFWHYMHEPENVNMIGERYWTEEEVVTETEKLAEQLADQKKFPLTEPKEFGGICVFCKKQYWGPGNKSKPMAEGLCCDECHWRIVMPAWVKDVNKKYSWWTD